MLFFFSSRRRHTRYIGDWSSDVCSSDLILPRSFRQVEREGLELDGEVDVLEPDVARQADPGRREVEHGLDPGEIGRASCREECRCRWWPDRVRNNERHDGGGGT